MIIQRSYDGEYEITRGGVDYIFHVEYKQTLDWIQETRSDTSYDVELDNYISVDGFYYTEDGEEIEMTEEQIKPFLNDIKEYSKTEATEC